MREWDLPLPLIIEEILEPQPENDDTAENDTGAGQVKQ